MKKWNNQQYTKIRHERINNGFGFNNQKPQTNTNPYREHFKNEKMKESTNQKWHFVESVFEHFRTPRPAVPIIHFSLLKIISFFIFSFFHYWRVWFVSKKQCHLLIFHFWLLIIDFWFFIIDYWLLIIDI